MRLDKDGEDLIKGFEGCRLTAYQDQGGVESVGYGHTGKDVHKGLTITQEKADALFDHDVEWVEDAVNKDVTVKMTQNEFNALCSLCYNIGAGAFYNSTLLKDLNKGEYTQAQGQFKRWNHVDGHVNKGLTNRRAKEAEVFGT